MGDTSTSTTAAATEAEFLGNEGHGVTIDVDSLLRGAVEAWQMGSKPPVVLHEVVSPGRVWQVVVFGVHAGTIDRRARRRYVAYGRAAMQRTRTRRTLDAAVLARITGGAR